MPAQTMEMRDEPRYFGTIDQAHQSCPQHALCRLQENTTAAKVRRDVCGRFSALCDPCSEAIDPDLTAAVKFLEERAKPK